MPEAYLARAKGGEAGEDVLQVRCRGCGMGWGPGGRGKARCVCM